MFKSKWRKSFEKIATCGYSHETEPIIWRGENNKYYELCSSCSKILKEFNNDFEVRTRAIEIAKKTIKELENFK